MKIDIVGYATFAVMDHVWKQTPPRTDVSAFMDWKAVQRLDDAPFNMAMNEVTRLIAEAQRRSAIHARDMAKALKAAETEAAVTGAVVVPEDVLIGSDKFDAVIDIDGHKVQLGEIVRAAQEDSGATVDEWNALPQEDRDALIQGVIDEARGEEGAQGDTQKGQEQTANA